MAAAPTHAMRSVAHPVIDRILAGLLLLLMAIGSLWLWIGMPLSTLYLLSKVTSSSSEHLALGVIVVPMAMVLFAVLLFMLNALYLRVTAPIDEEDEVRSRGPLELFLLWSLAISVVWLAFVISWPIAIALALVLIAFPRFPRRGW